jgi:hypothetical protein
MNVAKVWSGWTAFALIPPKYTSLWLWSVLIAGYFRQSVVYPPFSCCGKKISFASYQRKACFAGVSMPGGRGSIFTWDVRFRKLGRLYPHWRKLDSSLRSSERNSFHWKKSLTIIYVYFAQYILSLALILSRPQLLSSIWLPSNLISFASFKFRMHHVPDNGQQAFCVYRAR